MSKCNKVICDICGEHSKYSSPNDGTLKIKAKEWFECWDDSGWSRKTIHICNNCFYDLQTIILRERKNQSMAEEENEG